MASPPEPNDKSPILRFPLLNPPRPPVPRSYPARFAAWRAYMGTNCAGWTPRDEAIAKQAFVAGWEAGKKAQYRGES